MKIGIDTPIQNPKDDVLGRAILAQSFSEQLLSLDASEGLVVGVLGPWGSGKTSFVNLVRPHLKKEGIEILDFNPWMFSGPEQLVKSFFIELSAQIRGRDCRCFDELSTDLERYGKLVSTMAWIPEVGSAMAILGPLMRLSSKLFPRREGGVAGLKNKVEKALNALGNPLVVVVDDIDRLTTAEIRVVFKLVRLTANFPNVIYVTPFDRVRVEKALADPERGLSGRDYLEKILQLGFDLPEVPIQMLRAQIGQEIENALAGIENPGRFDEERWPDVLIDIIQPLMRTLRHVRRYGSTIHGTVRGLNGQVALVDVFALEAVRMYLPDLFSALHRAMPALTRDPEVYFPHSEDRSEALENQIKELIKKARDHSGVAERLVDYLFPAARRQAAADTNAEWLRERRVAHEAFLRLYLERSPNEGVLSFTEAEQAWDRMADGEAFGNYLGTLAAERRQEVIAHLEVYEDQFTPEHVVPGSVALLNLLPELPDLRQGFFDLEARHVVRRVVLRLLRKLDDPTAIEDVVRRILPQIKKLSSKLELITIIGYQKGAGHKLVSPSAALRFKRNWRDEVRDAPVESLATETNLLRTFAFVRQDSAPDERPLKVPDSPNVTRALLESARTMTREQVGRVVHRSFRLEWDDLVDVCGSEKILRNRIEKLKSTKPRDFDDVLELVDKYLAGYRHQGLERARKPD